MFDIETTSSFNKDKLVTGNEYDYVTRTSLNQGILQNSGFINEESLNPKDVWSLGLLQMDFFYRKKHWYAGQFVRKVIPKFKTTEYNVIFFTAILNRLKPVLAQFLVSDINEIFLKQVISLPYKNGKIDFNFIDDFIAQLQSNRMNNLAFYLNDSGLNNFELTETEWSLLNSLKDQEWELFKMDSILRKVPTKKLSYKAKELPTEQVDDYVLPCLTSSFKNQGLNYYVPKENATVLKNVITIPSNSDVYRAYFQSKEFTILSDAYAIEWKNDNEKLNKNHYLFIVMCINKVTDLPQYSYKSKLGGWQTVKNKNIYLPVRNGNIDFEFMDIFIRSISKLNIEDVVKYLAEKL